MKKIIKDIIKSNKTLLRISLFIYRLTLPFHRSFVLPFYLYIIFINDYIKFKKIGGRVKLLDIYPLLYDKLENTDFDTHYTWQQIQVLEWINESKVTEHTDIGSHLNYVIALSLITNVNFIDIRPPKIKSKNLNLINGTILDLPYNNASISSISSLHVLEHIGLGRYGDEIMTDGPIKAMSEISRVLKQEGNLYLSFPVSDRMFIQFNSQYVFDEKFVSQFEDDFDLKLMRFSFVDRSGQFVNNSDWSVVNNFKSLSGNDVSLFIGHFKKR